VSFEVDRADASDCWRSVIADGVYEEIEDASARQRALRIIYPEPSKAPDLGPETVFFRIRFTAKSGRYEVPD
jgi:nitroimidazol reductase NimA-like FMN-containing flavoprotein (pyridoxamine 5'-phosphate oxidase superfamily)